MQVDWNTPKGGKPIIFHKQAQWLGLKFEHARVAPGELHESSPPTHKITITLAGALTTRRQTAAGKQQIQERSPGNLCLNATGQSFSARWKDEFEYLMINLEPSFLMQFARENNFSSQPKILEIIPTESDPLIEHIGLALVSDNAAEGNSSSRLYGESLAQSLMLHLLKNYTSAATDSSFANFRGGLSGYKLRRVEEFVRENLDRDLSLAEMAAAANLSQFHFARAFRRSTGNTPQQYLMQKRIELAKDLLAQSNLPIVEISIRAGFKNQSHFTNLFRKMNAFPPKIWREINHS